MFNEKVKKKFITEQEDPVIQIMYGNLFNITEKIELKYKQDIYELSQSKLDGLIECLGLFPSTTIGSKKTYLSNYVAWCISLKLCKINSLKMLSAIEIKNMLEDKLIQRYYLNHEKYLEYKESMEAQENGLYTSTIFQAIYEGISGESYQNLVHLRLKDIDMMEGNILSLFDGTRLVISYELKDKLRIVSNLTGFTQRGAFRYFSHGLYPDSVWKFKNAGYENTNNRRFRVAMQNVKSLTHDDNLTKESVESSGLFYRVVTLAQKEGLDIKSDLETRVITRRISDLSKKYENILRKCGTTMPFVNFKNDYQDYIQYIL